MKEIVTAIQELENELNKSKAEVRRLANEEVIDTFKIIEHCTQMNTIMTTVVILGRIDEKAKDNTIPYCN